MISLIHNIIFNDPFNDDIAIIVLDEIEKAGMLPPYSEKMWLKTVNTYLEPQPYRWESEYNEEEEEE